MKKTKLETLSPLEEDVLNIVWKKKETRVSEIHKELKKNKSVALCSVAVILDRLYAKQIVDRKIETCRGGLRYIYTPRKNKKEFEISVMEKAVDSLISKFGKNAVSYFNERFSKK